MAPGSASQLQTCPWLLDFLWSKPTRDSQQSWVERYVFVGIYCVWWRQLGRRAFGGPTPPTWRESNKAAIHILFQQWKNISPDTENGERGQSAKTTVRVRSPVWIRICFLWATSRTWYGEKKPGFCSPEFKEGKKEGPDPVAASGTLGLCGLGCQRELFWFQMRLQLLRLN